MTCHDARELLDAYADDELDIVTARQIDAHLKDCPACAKNYDGTRAVKTVAANPTLYFAAPAGLRDRILASIESAAPTVIPPHRSWTIPWRSMGLAAAVLLVVSVGISVMNRSASTDFDSREVLAAHLRSLQADHLMDVASTDQHTVKPWLDRRLDDFAAPVVKLDSDGYVLDGGRLDYLHNRQAAALVYHHNKHIINLFIWPGESGNETLVRQGYNLVHWSSSGMTFWAISDLNAAELETFASLLRSHITAPTTK